MSLDSADSHQLREHRSKSLLDDVDLDMTAQLLQDPVERLCADHGSFGLIDRYREGRVGIELWGRLQSMKVDTPYWLALFENASANRYVRGWRNRRGPPHTVGIKHTDDNQHKTVLVDIIEHPKQPQRVIVTSLVRLAFVKSREDLFAFDLRHQPSFERHKLPVFITGTFTNGKLSLTGRNLFIKDHQLVGQVIKSRSQVENYLTNNYTPFRSNNGESISPENMLSCLMVDLSSEFITLGIKSPFGYFLQIGKMSLRSLYLYVCPFQS